MVEIQALVNSVIRVGPWVGVEDSLVHYLLFIENLKIIADTLLTRRAGQWQGPAIARARLQLSSYGRNPGGTLVETMSSQGEVLLSFVTSSSVCRAGCPGS